MVDYSYAGKSQVRSGGPMVSDGNRSVKNAIEPSLQDSLIEMADRLDHADRQGVKSDGILRR